MTKKVSTFLLNVVTILFILQQSSIAQQDYIKFRHLTIEQGLSLNSIFAVTQDKYGFMWFGSSDGLNRYDGKNVVIYKHDPENPNSLSSKRIYTLMEDSNGLLWVGTANGLNSYDYRTQTFTRYLHDPNDSSSISNNTVRSLYEDQSGGFWIGTDNGLNYFDRENDVFIHFKHDPENQNSISHSRIWSIFQDSKGTLWIGTPGGLNRYDKKNQSFSVNYKTDNNAQNEIHSICEDKYGNLWLGTRNGIVCINQTDQSFLSYTQNSTNKIKVSHNKVWRVFTDEAGTIWAGTLGGGLNKIIPDAIGKISKVVFYQKERSDPSSLNHNYIWSIFQDRTGVLWFGTEAGLNIYDTYVKKFIHYKHNPDNPNSLIHDEVNVFCEDKNGDLWIGTRGGLNKYDISKKRFYRYSTKTAKSNRITNDYVRAIHVDREGKIWIGTDGGGLTCYDENRKKFSHYLYTADKKNNTNYNKILSIYEDTQNILWLGTLAGLARFDRKNNRFHFYQSVPDDPQTLSHNYVYLIYEDQSGRLWIGTDNGLNQFNREKEIFIQYKKDKDNSNSLSNNTILSIYEDEKGILWIGTAGGLNRFDPDNNSYVHYREKDGLVNEVIFGLLADDHGNFWLSSNKGLIKFNPKSKDVKIFTGDDGLQSDQFNMSAYYKAKNGRMYFGGINGFNAFYPDEIKNNPFLPQIVITDFKMLNKSVPLGEMEDGRTILQHSITETESIELTYEDKIISFEFAALQYNNPEKNKYAYILEGFDDTWQYVNNRKFATYTSLPSGQYVFKVKASNNDEVWNEDGASIQIFIAPPFWLTTWFITFSVIFVLILILAIYKLRTRAIRKANRELEQHVNERTQELRIANQEAQRRAIQASLIYQVGHRLSYHLNIDKLFNEVVSTILDAFDYYCVMIFLLDKEAGALKVKSKATKDQKIIFPDNLQLKLKEGLIGEAGATGKSQVCNDITDDKLYVKKANEVTESELAVPIKYENEVIGVLDIQSDKKHAFDRSDIDVIETLSAQISTAINNAKLYEKAQQEIEERTKAEKIAEAAANAKSVFLANMSHEIRTPLNGVIGMTNLVLDTHLTKEQREHLEIVQSSADNLLTVINDVLDFSKIEAGKLDLESIQFDLRITAEDIAELLAFKAYEKGLELTCIIDQEIHTRLYGDPGRVRQILLNLINNAIKFTEKGEVIVRISQVEDQVENNILRFEVTDTGIGISDEKMDRLFKSFSQVDASTTRKYGGTGLGLAISKQLVQLMGGEIGVNSREGQGSTFWFTIPFKKQTTMRSIMKLPRKEVTNQRILIVDDNETNRRVLKEQLTNWGFDFEEAPGGKIALQKLVKGKEENRPFSIAILDMQMPEMDGETLGKEIKGNPEIADVSLIMLTSIGQRGDVKRLRDIGFSAYLNKPIRQSQLYDCLVLVIGDKKITDDKTETSIFTKYSLAENKSKDYNLLLAEDNVINQKVAVRILQKFGFRVDVVVNGKEAVETLKQKHYDLVLMDIQMPEMDGFEATNQIRKSKKVLNNSIPIIAMTAHAMKGDRDKCFDAGMNDYVSKPINTKELIDVLEKQLINSGSKTNIAG